MDVTAIVWLGVLFLFFAVALICVWYIIYYTKYKDLNETKPIMYWITLFGGITIFLISVIIFIYAAVRHHREELGLKGDVEETPVPTFTGEAVEGKRIS